MSLRAGPRCGALALRWTRRCRGLFLNSSKGFKLVWASLPGFFLFCFRFPFFASTVSFYITNTSWARALHVLCRFSFLSFLPCFTFESFCLVRPWVMSACTLDVSAGSFKFLAFASPVIRQLLPRCSVGVFFVFSSDALIQHTHTHIPATQSTHTHPGTCSHAEMPHYTSAVRPLNLLECHFYRRVCVPTVLHSTLPAWLVKMLSFLLLQFFFFQGLVWIITMLSFTTKQQEKKNLLFWEKATFRKIRGKSEQEIWIVSSENKDAL